MRKSLAIAVALALTFFIAVVIGWATAYPSDSDPKNIKYVLWKNGLYGMNLDAATVAMIGDANSEKLVIGKTKVQLREKFGYLSTPAHVSQYLRGCYQASAWKGRDVLFIRNGPWMIIFDGDNATKLVLIVRPTCRTSANNSAFATSVRWLLFEYKGREPATSTRLHPLIENRLPLSLREEQRETAS